jgi:hydroxypyruvate reductase
VTTQREHAGRIIRAALAAVDPAAAVRRHLRAVGGRLIVADANGERDYGLHDYERVLVVGAGKAGAPMVDAAAAILGERLSAGIIIVKYGHITASGAPERVTIVEAGHPVPDVAGMQGAQRLADLLRQTTERDLVICLLSGGGSALMTLPVPSVALADLQALTRTLLACGATINEINALRKHLSQLQGGQLARLAAPATVVSLILSDVIGDPLDVIASGPTVADPTTYADAWTVLERHGVLKQVPAAILAHLRSGMQGDVEETPKPGDAAFGRVQNVVIGSNRIAARAAAAAAWELGYHSLLLSTFVEGEAREVAKVVAGLAKGVARGECVCPPEAYLAMPACLILGGETTVTLRGSGRGGRNQELALAAALALDGWPGMLVTCLATDGTDGPTDAAGAFADGESVRRAAALGLSAADHLARNDTYPFFAALGDLIMTGPTQTNVNDLVLVLVMEDHHEERHLL